MDATATANPAATTPITELSDEMVLMLAQSSRLDRIERCVTWSKWILIFFLALWTFGFIYMTFIKKD
jgi:hypothetical protein